MLVEARKSALSSLQKQAIAQNKNKHWLKQQEIQATPCPQQQKCQTDPNIVSEWTLSVYDKDNDKAWTKCSQGRKQSNVTSRAMGIQHIARLNMGKKKNHRHQTMVLGGLW